ncbi:MAG: hypothetical protein A2666_00570 [Parcubacteria group bacterium RIFCSPHIGHO2_01_FULL_47_10b]|nr:MAG: hypothetical protein A2666_00570 [Parcubacteria group bacterium RIFCSPHIGHO2_01_FULL_47_10b]
MKKTKEKILIIGGAGYVGLATTVAFGLKGVDVISVDIDAARVAKLNAGIPPFYEAGMEKALKQVLASGNVRFQTSFDADDCADRIIFVTVATPTFSDGSSDFKQIAQVFLRLKDHIRKGHIIVIKSTVPVGGLAIIQELMLPRVLGSDYHMAYNPEFLREGSALTDFMQPDRIVIGGDAHAVQRVASLYKPWTDTNVPLVETDFASAQLIKYAANAYLATRVSFINEIAALAEKFDASIRDTIRGISLDARIGSHYLSPGLGFGGPCLEKDLHALIQSAGEHGYRASVLHAVLERNAEQITIAIRKLRALLKPSLVGKHVAVWGLAFKKNSSDIRASLPLRLVERLAEEEVQVHGFDPMAMEEVRERTFPLTLHRSALEAARDADALLVLVNWDEFAAPTISPQKLKKVMKNPVIIDMVNSLDGKEFKKAGFTYYGFGQR